MVPVKPITKVKLETRSKFIALSADVYDCRISQAELVSVEGKEIESHYVLAREPIHKWNSSSDCYLLIEGVEHTLQVCMDF